LKIEQKIHFLGKRGDVAKILSSLDISVLSSISEGLSNAILESMAAAKPVVATRVGGNPEIIIDGSTGYLVQSEDSEALAEAIIKLLQDPEKAVTMGETGQKLIREKFTINLMVNNYERLYSSLFNHCQ
jgi:glycosyltransferase involved in cell wall biosynthesis